MRRARLHTSLLAAGLGLLPSCDGPPPMPAGDPPDEPPPVVEPLPGDPSGAEDPQTGGGETCISCQILLEVFGGGVPGGLPGGGGGLTFCEGLSETTNALVQCGCGTAACAEQCGGTYCDEPVDFEQMQMPDLSVFACLGCAAEATECTETAAACEAGEPAEPIDGLETDDTGIDGTETDGTETDTVSDRPDASTSTGAQ